jgi:hypothetical protein
VAGLGLVPGSSVDGSGVSGVTKGGTFLTNSETISAPSAHGQLCFRQCILLFKTCYTFRLFMKLSSGTVKRCNRKNICFCDQPDNGYYQ